MADLSEGSDNPLNFAVTSRDRNTLKMVADAIEYNQTLLAFQPVVQATSPYKPAFYEGLIRVIDETGRVIPAKDFMPVVEDTELGRKIDCLALRMGLKTLVRHPGLRLSINMSARSIGYKPWMKILNRHLGNNPHLGERLILEITESSAMQVPELAVRFMDELQAHGIAFALDDFGSGFTAFRYFKDFFFDAVKIDGEFISGIHKNPDNQVLTKALVEIARQFDMLTIAEYVENKEDAEYLEAIGMDCLQGHYFGAATVQPDWASQEQAKAAG